MVEINVLDSTIFNRIAAGEVVESPVSIVKELVENSIDAGANSIIIEILNGGIDFIKVIDNGVGISKLDLPNAFLPHATSKIKSLADLNNIGTLGFRGEALPSIASVAQVTMNSRKQDSEIGNSITIENGKIICESEVGMPLGTEVVVKDLFKNVPARKKFLKKPSSEAASITEFMQKIILANPNISIKYINENNLILHSASSGIESAIYTVYGEMLENLDYIESIMPDITLRGYVSKPAYSKHNRNYQIFIVNGRVVENDDLSYCIYLCYQDYLMKRQFPMFILYIDLPLDMVDVNVHPNKLKIKFSDFNRVKNFIVGAIKKSINKEILIPKNISTASNFYMPENEIAATNYSEKKVTSDMLFGENQNNTLSVLDFKNKITSSSVAQMREDAHSVIQNQNNDARKSTIAEFINLQKLASVAQPLQFDNIAETQMVIGKIFNTYIIMQKGNSIYLIDQHAAHEKILFDKYVKDIDNKNIALQDLLIPYVFSVNNKEMDNINSYLHEIIEIGFIVSQFGESSFSISAVPAICTNISLKEFVPYLLDVIDSNKKIKQSDFLKETIAQSACKAAVKGLDDLSKDEINNLISEMEKNGGALFCPHGRPTIIKLTKSEIEKWFKRIV